MKNENDKAATEWLRSLKATTRSVYQTYWKYFLEFTKMTGDQILADRKKDKKHKWARLVLEFKQWLIDEKQLAAYTATTAAMAVRGFFAYHYCKLEYRRQESKRLSEKMRKTEDYLFSVEDLKRMADVANLSEKYVLVAGKSFGLRAGDFLRLKRGDLEAYIDRPVPISIGKIDTGKEKVPAYPFIDSDAQPIIKLMLEQMDRKERAKPTDRVLTYKWEKELSQTLKRLAKRAGLKVGNKQVRFHCLRKFLIDNISSLMSESKWKQIVGKKISEDAYVSPDSLREDYERAMTKTTFTKSVQKADVELLAKKEALIMLAKLQGMNEAELKKIFRSRKARTTEEQIKLLETLTEKNTATNGGCANGKHCQKIVSEAELGGMLAEGWRVAAVLPSGKIVVSNE
jgi:integrase